jgi:hypothetical protein
MDSLKELRLSLNDILRYGFGGVASFIAFAFVDPSSMRAAIDTLGGPVVAVMALAAGAGVYAFYRPVGDLFLYPLADRLHRSRPNRPTRYCRNQFLEEVYGAPRKYSVDAYRLVRDSDLFDKTRRERYTQQHSEIHVLYITFTVFTIALIVLVMGRLLFGAYSDQSIATVGMVSLLVLALAIVADNAVCRQECHYLRTLDHKAAWALLKKAGLTDLPEAPPDAA